MIRSFTPVALAAAAGLLCGCVAEPLPKPVVGYTCCNLSPVYGAWISSNNVQGGTRLPAGQKAHFESIKRTYYVYGQIGGQDYGLRNDSGHDEKSTLEFLLRTIVLEDPNVALATWPADVQAAVHAAKVQVGMTRPQVAMALGYPSPEDTPKLDDPVWRYWVIVGDQRVELHFDAEGKLAAVTGKPEAVAEVFKAS